MNQFGMVLLFALSSCAIAQPSRGTWTNVTQLASGTDVRVSVSGIMWRGRLQSVTADSMTLNVGRGQEMLPRAEVSRVEYRRAGHRGRHALIGLGIGAAGGLGIGAAVDSGNHTNFFPNFGKAALTPLGAIVGTVAGAAIPAGGWREIYRAP